MRRSVHLAGCALIAAVALVFVVSPALATPSSATQPNDWFGPVGLAVNRIFDVANGDVTYFSKLSAPASLVSSTIFGLDMTLPLAEKTGAFGAATLFGEAAASERTNDLQNLMAASRDVQAVGINFKLLAGDQSVAFQSVGPNFGSNAPFPYSGQSPALFAFYNFAQLSAPIGTDNGLSANRQANNAAIAAGFNAPLSANGLSPLGSSAFPLFNTFKAQGPSWYSTYSPAMRGSSLQLSFPIRVAKIPAKIRVGEQALTEVQSSSLATQIFGPAFASSAAGKYNALSGGVTLALPLFDRRATVSLDGLYETLRRNDKTPFLYTANPGQSPNNPFAGSALDAVPTAVFYYPNYADLRRYLGTASVAVPVSSSLTVKGSFSEQRYGGEALDTLTQSLSKRKTAYGGGVAYNIPNTNSSVNLFFNRYVFSDDALPTYNWTENRQNIYFSVKF